MQIINTRKIFEKIINQNIAKNIYKEYNIVNQKIFAIINLRKSIKNGEKYLKTSLRSKRRIICRCIGNISSSSDPQNTNLIS